MHGDDNWNSAWAKHFLRGGTTGTPDAFQGLHMNTLQSVLDRIGGNGAKVYQCISCGGLVTHSDRLIPVHGRNRHFFVNPAGLECDFHTFFSCPGAVAVGGATSANSWFSGYRWRFALCRQCGQHLGWYYEAVSVYERPMEFWGILVNQLVDRSPVSHSGI